MTLTLLPNRILITDGATTAFDTDWRQLHWVDFKQGTFSLPQRQAQSFFTAPSNNVAVDTNHVVDTVPSGADLVQGMVRTNYTSGLGSTDTLWRSVAGGTFIDVSEVCYLTFFVSGGVLYLNEQTTITLATSFNTSSGSPTFTATLAARTLEYRLYIGAFDE